MLRKFYLLAIGSPVLQIVSSLIVGMLLLGSCQAKKEHDSHSIAYLGEEEPGDIPRKFGEDIISQQGRFELGLTISPDGQFMVFGVAHEAIPEETCLYIMRNNEGSWTAPHRSFLEENVNTFFPMFGPDGGQFYFVKSTNGEPTDIWVGQFNDGKVSNPQPLDSIFNSSSREAGHGKAKNGSFYFTSNRDDQHQCCGDIYYSPQGPNGYYSAEKVEELNSEADEESLFLSPTEDYIILQAWKGVGSKHDLYISYRTKEDQWTTPLRLPDEINSEEIEQRPFVSPDNRFLFFSRMTVFEATGEERFESDLYWVSTRKIFKPFTYHTDFDTTIGQQKPFNIKVPHDLFRDIDDTELTYQLLTENNRPLPEWIDFDSTSLTISGTFQSKGPVVFSLIATDDAGNSGTFRFEIGS